MNIAARVQGLAHVNEVCLGLLQMEAPGVSDIVKGRGASREYENLKGIGQKMEIHRIEILRRSLYRESQQLAENAVLTNSRGRLAERVGFEPTVRFPAHAFQACALSHSAISPERPLLKGRR